MAVTTFADDEPDDLDDDIQTCEFCGRDINGYDGHPCPFCCSHSFAPGSEECDWCLSSERCFMMYHRRGLA